MYFANINFHSVLAYASSLPHQAPTQPCGDVYVVGGAAGGRILLGCGLSQCGSLAACTGGTIIVAKELFITVLPQQDSWGRMLVLRLLFHVHTSTHTAAASLFNERRTLFRHKLGVFFFPKEVTCMAEKRKQLQPQSIHTSAESLEASPQIAITFSWTHHNWQHG